MRKSSRHQTVVRQVSFRDSANMVAERRRSMAIIEMTDSLPKVGKQLLELSVEERNLLSVACGSTAGCRRAAGLAREGVRRESGE